MDYEILSKYCFECTTTEKNLGKNSPEFDMWYNSHVLSECQKNYSGSSNAMKKDIAEIIWRRSVVERAMRYTVMLSDRYAKTHTHLNTIQVYGPQIKIEKQECVNHISKRLGTGLRNVVKEWKTKGVTLGGRREGSLKESTITKSTSYYRHAIVNNIPNVEVMKCAIFATLRHYASTDDRPQHDEISSLELIYKWGCDGSQQVQYKQKFENSHDLMLTYSSHH